MGKDEEAVANEAQGNELHPDPICEGRTFSQIVASGGDVNPLFPDRSPVKPPKKLPYRVFSALVLPGGRMISGGSPDGAVDVIHPDTGAIEMHLKGHIDSVMALAINHQGIFSASADHEIKRWSLSTFEELKTYYGHEGMITALVTAPIPGNTCLFSAGDDEKIMQWNIETSSCVYIYDDHKAPINCLKADAQFLYSGDGDGILIVADLTRRTRERKIKAHLGGVWSLAYNDEEDILYTGGGDGCVRVWKDIVNIGSCSLVLRGHEGPVRALLEEKGTLFTAGADGFVSCWDTHRLTRTKCVEVFRLYLEGSNVACTKAVTMLGLANNELVAVGFDRVVNRWDVASLLHVEQDMIELPPLDALEGIRERERTDQLPPQERHWLYCQGEVEESLRKYTELPINYILESLEFKVRNSWLNFELLLYIPFLIMFIFFFMYDYDSLQVFHMNDGMSTLLETEDIGGFKLARSFMDIDKTKLWVMWVSGLFFDQIWNGKAETGWWEPLRFQGANQLIGAVRFRTQRVHNRSCVVNEQYFNYTALKNVTEAGLCFSEHHSYSDGSVMQTKPFACEFPYRTGCAHNATAMKEVLGFQDGLFPYNPVVGSLFRGTKFYPEGGHTVDIPGYVSTDEAKLRGQVMIDNGFVDDTATRLIAIEFFSYNPTLQTYVSTRLMGEVYLGGSWHMVAERSPFRIFQLDTSRGKLIYELVFLLYVIMWFINYFLNLRRDLKLEGTVLSYLFNMWNFLDIANVLIFLAMFYYRWAWFNASQLALTQMPFDMRGYPFQLDDIVQSYRIQVSLNAINTVLTFLKILKYMQLNEQLNILSRTLAMAQQNIIGVLVLFIYFVFAFAIAGNGVYGTGLWGFRTLDGSYNTLLRMLVGDADYDGMSVEAREYTVVFHWVFIICAQFLLLNFLVAVMGDSFQEVCATRLPITLDRAIVRAADDVRRQFLPSYVRVTLLLLHSRRTRTAITAKQFHVIRKYRESLLSEEAKRYRDYDELDLTYISKQWFITHVPKELLTDDNINFMEEVWGDICWEWHFRLRDKYMQERHEQEETVRAVLQEHFKPMKDKTQFLDDCAAILKGINHKLSRVGVEL